MEIIVIVALLLSLVGCLPYIGTILIAMVIYWVATFLIKFFFGGSSEE